MTTNEELFHKIAAGIPGAMESKMFDALCIKAQNGKAGVMFYQDDIVLKMPQETEKELLELEGVKPFDPMGGRPMGGWVQVPGIYANMWSKYALIAMDFVSKIETVEKQKKKK